MVSESSPSGRLIVSVHLMLPALAGSGPHCPGVFGFCDVEVTCSVVTWGSPPAGVTAACVVGFATAVSVTLIAAVAAVMYCGLRAVLCAVRPADCTARCFALVPLGMMNVSVTGAVPPGAVLVGGGRAGGAPWCVPPPPPQPARRTAAVKKAATGRKTVNTGTSNAKDAERDTADPAQRAFRAAKVVVIIREASALPAAQEKARRRTQRPAMRIVLGGLIALVVVACGVPAPRAEAQEMGASLSAPFRHDIDARCDAYDATPAKSWVHFQRLTGRPGVTPRWTLQRSGPPPSAAASGGEALDPGT